MKKEKIFTIAVIIAFVIVAGVFYIRYSAGGVKTDGQYESAEMFDTEAPADEVGDSGEAGGSRAKKNNSSGDTSSDDSKTANTSDSDEYAVYICGAVKNTGVYRFSEAVRVCDAIEAAGGLKSNASTKCINQARYINDGEQIYILTKKEYKKASGESGSGVGDVTDTGSGSSDTVSGGENGSAANGSGKVDINQADVTGLTSLPGIGEQRAQAIIEYREKSGSFSSPEDIKNVTGIKDGIYNNIKDFITVG